MTNVRDQARTPTPGGTGNMAASLSTRQPHVLVGSQVQQLACRAMLTTLFRPDRARRPATHAASVQKTNARKARPQQQLAGATRKRVRHGERAKCKAGRASKIVAIDKVHDQQG